MASPLQPGEVLAGRYRVERILGEGGMGVVVAAEHLMLGERVAVKFLLPESLRAPEVIARFHREARAAARIQSEHVCRVMDVGTLDGGAPYLVMEYLEGHDLARELEVRGPLPAEEAVDYVLQASVGLAEAHALGIVHRDLKPSNLFLARLATGRRLIKVLDFGIAKHGGDTKSTELTHTFSALGSAAYMSPEQVRMAKSVDARTDVWALGVVLYQLMTTRIPFEGESLFAIAAAITADAPAPLSTLCPDVPKGLEVVVHRCLEKLRDARFASLAELATALAPFGGRGAAVHASRIADALDADGAEPRPPLGSSAELAVPSAEGSSPRHALPASNVPSAVSRSPVASAGRSMIVDALPVVQSVPEAVRVSQPIDRGANAAVSETLGSGSTWSRTGGLASTGRQSLARLLQRRSAVVALSLTGLAGLGILVAVALGSSSSDGTEETLQSATPPGPSVAATAAATPVAPRPKAEAPVIHSVSDLDPAPDDIEVIPAKPTPAGSPKRVTAEQPRTTSASSTSTKRPARTTAPRKAKESSEAKKPTIVKDL